MKTFVFLDRVDVDGKTYTKGDTAELEMSEAQELRLLELGVIGIEAGSIDVDADQTPALDAEDADAPVETVSGRKRK